MSCCWRLFAPRVTLTASTSYSFGSTNQITFDSAGASPTYTRGVWTENFTGTNTTTTEQIVCVVGLTVANETDTCGSPGPGTAQHIGITTGGQPGNSAILPTGTTNYAEIDGDPDYGAPISTQMTGLTINTTYQVSFYQASNEEDGNNKVYTDNWLVYTIPGTTGQYICLSTVCNANTPGFPAVSPPAGATLAFTSASMNNPGASSTPWVLQTFSFKATAVTEVLEFVTQAVGTGTFAPPLFDLAGVTTQVAPEPGTWVMMLLGSGLLFAGYRLRRRASPAYKRVLRRARQQQELAEYPAHRR